MINARISAILIGVSVFALSACGGTDTTSTDAAAPTATTSAAAPAAEATTSAAAAAPAASDKELCAAAEKVSKEFKNEILEVFKSGGDVTPEVGKKLYTQLATGLSEAAGSGDSAVATAMKQMADEAAKGAASANPVEDGDTKEAEKAGAALTAACKEAGVKVVY
ncbi:hypothetical protein Acsp01_72840 [Actinoplanes sp. NBRC 101535]|nr:hypothetical protein Acsp01_72840 [Actinoplanes sp. NBRC 101535]